MIIQKIRGDKARIQRLRLAVSDAQTILRELQRDIVKPMSIDPQAAGVLLDRLEGIQDQILKRDGKMAIPSRAVHRVALVDAVLG